MRSKIEVKVKGAILSRTTVVAQLSCSADSQRLAKSLGIPPQPQPLASLVETEDGSGPCRIGGAWSMSNLESLWLRLPEHQQKAVCAIMFYEDRTTAPSVPRRAVVVVTGASSVWLAKIRSLRHGS